MKLRIKFFILIFLPFFLFSHAYASPEKDAIHETLKQLKSFGYTIEDINDANVKEIFPNLQLVVVRFRQYPIAIVPPEGFKYQNILYREKDGVFHNLTNFDELKLFFINELPVAKTENDKIASVKGLLVLSEELNQDGFYKFVISESILIKKDDTKTEVFGKFIVESGGKGELIAALVFDETSRLVDVSESGRLIPGIRPICQATKLLDADPLVRRMAEQDILVMGKSAKPYLDYIRPQLSIALRKEADRIWKKIIEEDL